MRKQDCLSYLAAEVSDNDRIRHPACNLNKDNFDRIAFMHALTAPFFENKSHPPFRFIKATRVPAEATAAKRNRDGVPVGTMQFDWSILCEIPRLADGEPAGSVEFIVPAELVESDSSLLSQESLMRPYHRNVRFWESVTRINIIGPKNHYGDKEVTIWKERINAAIWDLGQRCSRTQTRPEVTHTVDLLLTILIEVNYQRDQYWNVGFCFCHAWLAHAAKFQAGLSSSMTIPMEWQRDGFFQNLRRLLNAFDLRALPNTTFSLMAVTSGSLDNLNSDFHGVFDNIRAVGAIVNSRTWPYIRSTFRANFPKLTKIVFHPNNDFGFPMLESILQFLIQHKNAIDFSFDHSHRSRDAFFVTESAICYVERARQMHAFVEADVATCPEQQVAQSFFRSPLFDPHLVHLVDRCLHGTRFTERYLGFNTTAGNLSARLD